MGWVFMLGLMDLHNALYLSLLMVNYGILYPNVCLDMEASVYLYVT